MQSQQVQGMENHIQLNLNEIVKGIHEPIISEALFYDVQNVLDGKKKAKTKYSLVDNEYPMRGHYYTTATIEKKAKNAWFDIP